MSGSFVLFHHCGAKWEFTRGERSGEVRIILVIFCRLWEFRSHEIGNTLWLIEFPLDNTFTSQVIY